MTLHQAARTLPVGFRTIASQRGRDAIVFLLFVLAGVVLWLTPPVGVIAALLTMILIGAVVSPTAVAAAVAASVPFIFHPVAIRDASFSHLEIILVLGSLGVAIRSVTFDRRRFDEIVNMVLIGDWRVTMVAVILAALGAVSLLTLADPNHRPESLRELRVVVIEPIAALALTRWAIRHEGGWLLLAGLAGAGAVVALIAVVQTIIGQGEVIGDGVRRATGPYPHPNNLALYLERISLFVAAIAYSSRRFRSIAAPVALLLGIGLATTLSRGALVAVTVGMAFLIWACRRARAWIGLMVAALLVVALFAVVAGDRFFASGSGGDRSSRELIWRSSIEMIRDHPIYGVGLDQFLYQYAPRYVTPAGWPERYTSHPHNVVLDVWLRLGVAGVGLLLAGVAMLIGAGRALRSDRAQSDRRVLGVAAVTMLIGGLAHGTVDNSFFLPDLAVMTWIGVALVEWSLREPHPGLTL